MKVEKDGSCICSLWTKKKKTTKRHFMDLFIPVQKNSVDFSQSVCYLWWDMDPPLYSETKEQWKQWASKDKPAPKKAKAVPSTNKVIATVLGCMWCHIDWLIRKGKNITILYYVTLLDKFNEKINNNKKRPPLCQKKFCSIRTMLHYTMSTTSIAKIHELWWKLLPHLQ